MITKRNKATSCNWCKKEFYDEYYCNKCYEQLDYETERSDNPEITCHEKKYPIEISDEELVDVEKTCKKYHEDTNDMNSCHNIKVVQLNKNVCHHNHYSGEFKNFLCIRCNLNEEYKTKFVPVYFHNLCGYNSHLFIKELISNLFVRNNLKQLKNELKKDPQNEALNIKL